ncbi:N-acetylglucosamine-6-phosphate deacetylase, partial [Nocardia cyriacigeorgica]|nr:N-acetylglucosamine-6-phosphate deacetylase [Nocardia cyriacigeorgica]
MASAVRRDIIDGVVVLDGDLISWVGPAAHYRGTAPVPPPSDSIVLPGLIDLHCHGGAGAGFPDTSISGA